MDTLTSLRGIAALTVLVFHLHFFSGPPFFRGYLAVDLFFLLSGFVLSHAYRDVVWTPATLRSFWRARFARVYPVHLVTLLLLLPWLGAAAWFSAAHSGNAAWDFTPGGFVSNLLLLQGPWHAASWNQPAWSISVEAHAYLLFPLLLSRYRCASLAAIAWTLAGCAAVLALLFHLEPGNTTNAPAVLLRGLPEFLVGVLLYELGRPGLLLRSDVSVIAVAGLLIVAEKTQAPMIEMVALLAVLLLGVAGNTGWVSRLLQTTPLLYLGKISYSLYMGQFLAALIAARAGAWAPAVFLGLSFAIAVPLSHWVEYPARAWLRRGRKEKTPASELTGVG